MGGLGFYQAARVERRVRGSLPEITESDDWPVTEAGLEQAAQLGEAGTDVFCHGRRLRLAVFDVKLLPFPLIDHNLALPVALGLGRLADRSRLRPLGFAKLLLADTCLPRALPLYVGPYRLPLGHRTPETAMPAPAARALIRTVTRYGRIVKTYTGVNCRHLMSRLTLRVGRNGSG